MATPLPASPIALPRLPYAAGIKLSYCVNTQKTLVMEERSVSAVRDTVYIRDEDDMELLQCRPKTSSTHKQKAFYDTQGNLLWTLKHRPHRLPKQYYGEDAHGREVFNVHGHWHWPGARMTVTFTNSASNNELVELVVSGNWVERYATVTMGEVPVAQITKDILNSRQVLDSADTYYVTIAPGMDVALIAALCVAFDENDN